MDLQLIAVYRSADGRTLEIPVKCFVNGTKSFIRAHARKKQIAVFHTWTEICDRERNYEFRRFRIKGLRAIS